MKSFLFSFIFIACPILAAAPGQWELVWVEIDPLNLHFTIHTEAYNHSIIQFVFT